MKLQLFTNMLTLFINLILIVIICKLLYDRYKLNRYIQELFVRAWTLELRFIHIYDLCPEDVQLEITRTLKDIKPL